MAKYEIKKEINQDTKKPLFHIYKGGRFFLTCESKKQVDKVMQILKAN